MNQIDYIKFVFSKYFISFSLYFVVTNTKLQKKCKTQSNVALI